MAETHDSSRRLRSSAEGRLGRLRGELVLQLYMRRGRLWEAVREVRSRWNIMAKVQLPPPVRGRLLPEDAPEAKDHRRYSDYAPRWQDEMSAIRAKIDPEFGLPTSDYSDYQLEASWSDFLSACVLYDPPEDQLVEFAAYGDLEPTFLDGGRILRKETIERLPKMADPPIKSLWALTELRDWYWRRILEYVGERYLEPQGVDVVEHILEDPVTHVPGLYEEYREKYERYSKRYYIEVDEYTSLEDVRSAFSMIIHSIRYRERVKPQRDRLTAVQCAILYDRHNYPLEDRRQWRWTYEKLGDEFGIGARAANDHVLLGREIIEGLDADEN